MRIRAVPPDAGAITPMCRAAIRPDVTRQGWNATGVTRGQSIPSGRDGHGGTMSG